MKKTSTKVKVKEKSKVKYKVTKMSLDPEYPYNVKFSIDHQSFHLSSVDTRETAKWYIKQLKTAFKRLQS